MRPYWMHPCIADPILSQPLPLTPSKSSRGGARGTKARAPLSLSLSSAPSLRANRWYAAATVYLQRELGLHAGPRALNSSQDQIVKAPSRALTKLSVLSLCERARSPRGLPSILTAIIDAPRRPLFDELFLGSYLPRTLLREWERERGGKKSHWQWQICTREREDARAQVCIASSVYTCIYYMHTQGLRWAEERGGVKKSECIR